MNPKTKYSIKVTLKIVDTTSQYTETVVEAITLEDKVPKGIDPVAYLRQRINAEFSRKFRDLSLDYNDDVIEGEE